MSLPLEPVTSSGWYECLDGSIGEFVWRAGRLDRGRVVADWASVPSREDDLRAAAAAQRAELAPT